MRLGSRYPGISGSLESSNGSSESTTGVPNKKYRGAQQKVPGCPTSTTGVPNKKYRGARQVALSKVAAKQDFSCRVSAALCFCFSCKCYVVKQQLHRRTGRLFVG